MIQYVSLVVGAIVSARETSVVKYLLGPTGNMHLHRSLVTPTEAVLIHVTLHGAYIASPAIGDRP